MVKGWVIKENRNSHCLLRNSITSVMHMCIFNDKSMARKTGEGGMRNEEELKRDEAAIKISGIGMNRWILSQLLLRIRRSLLDLAWKYMISL